MTVNSDALLPPDLQMDLSDLRQQQAAAREAYTAAHWRHIRAERAVRDLFERPEIAHVLAEAKYNGIQSREDRHWFKGPDYLASWFTIDRMDDEGETIIPVPEWPFSFVECRVDGDTLKVRRMQWVANSSDGGNFQDCRSFEVDTTSGYISGWHSDKRRLTADELATLRADIQKAKAC